MLIDNKLSQNNLLSKNVTKFIKINILENA